MMFDDPREFTVCQVLYIVKNQPETIVPPHPTFFGGVH